MNLVETKAFNWLVKEFDIEPQKIIYQSTSSPDFLLPDKQAYEVKRLYSNQIIIYQKQYKSLQHHKNCKILVFDDGNEPIAIIPLEEISPETPFWRNIKINFVTPSSKGHRSNIYFTSDEWQRLKQYSIKHFGKGARSITLVVTRAVNEFLDKREQKGGDVC